MGDQKFDGSILKVKPFLTSFKKINGKIVEQALEMNTDTSLDDDGLDNLLAGIEPQEIEAGREKLLAENPMLASQQVHDMMETEGFHQYADAEFMKRTAQAKRMGMLMDRSSQETINFKRIGAKVELTTEEGEVIGSLTNAEFDSFIESGDYTILG